MKYIQPVKVETKSETLPKTSISNIAEKWQVWDPGAQEEGKILKFWFQPFFLRELNLSDSFFFLSKK